MDQRGLNKMNRWLIVATIATAVLYAGYFLYHEITHPYQCCDGPCLTDAQMK